jgi:hypothetical protein
MPAALILGRRRHRDTDGEVAARQQGIDTKWWKFLERRDCLEETAKKDAAEMHV